MLFQQVICSTAGCLNFLLLLGFRLCLRLAIKIHQVKVVIAVVRAPSKEIVDILVSLRFLFWRGRLLFDLHALIFHHRINFFQELFQTIICNARYFQIFINFFSERLSVLLGYFEVLDLRTYGIIELNQDFHDKFYFPVDEEVAEDANTVNGMACVQARIYLHD